MSDILIMLLMCVESDKIPLYKCLPVGLLIDIAYTQGRIQGGGEHGGPSPRETWRFAIRA